VADPDVVVDLIPSSLVWAILRRYAHAQPGAGSQLANSGNGTAGRDAACTVAMKLERCPLVERVLFLQEAVDWIRSAREHVSKRDAAERASLVDLRTLRWAAHWAWSATHCQQDADRLMRTRTFREQWALMVCELSACFAVDGAFRAWVEGKT